MSIKLPNVRRMIIPDPGKILFDIDLAGADAQIVCWEADDADLKAKFRSGKKIHALNAVDIFGAAAGSDGKKEPYYTRAKMGCHASNYGASARTVAQALNITVHEAERFQARWFSLHPGILEWHKRTRAQLEATRTVYNRFGYRRVYFDRPDSVLKEALAFIPQSSVACITNRAWVNIDDSGLPIEILMQVHDSLVGQCPITAWPQLKPLLHSLIQIPVPYEDPLTIGWGLKTSTKSWGDCVGESWNEST